jgi:hypothetical protein
MRVLLAAVLLAIDTAPVTVPPEALDRANPVPQWQNGFLVVTPPESWSDSGEPNYKLYGRDGRLRLSERLVMPQAPGSRITAVAVAEDGSSAVAAEDVIALVDKSGKLERAWRISPAQAIDITLAPDRSVWVLAVSTTQDSELLRHHGRDGKLIGKFIPQPAPHDGWGYSEIHAIRDRVGAFLDSTQEWIEIDPAAGKVLGRWKLPTPIGTQGLTRLVLTDAGRLYAVTKGRPDLYEFDRGGPRWKILNQPHGVLLGTDGELLVFGSYRDRQLVWFDPSAPE